MVVKGYPIPVTHSMMALSPIPGHRHSMRLGRGAQTEHLGISSTVSRPLPQLMHDSVNLGGWFVLEPFISPALYERYPGAVDEWTLSQLMPAEELEEHYATFIVRLVCFSSRLGYAYNILD